MGGKMDKKLIILLLVTPILLYGCTGGQVSPPGGQTVTGQAVTIQDLITNPNVYANKTITVTGILRDIGANYYTNPHFVLQDENLNNITVTEWAPLEYMQPPPGSNITTMPKAMDYWLDKKLRVTGLFKYSEGSYYIDVGLNESNVEIL